MFLCASAYGGQKRGHHMLQKLELQAVVICPMQVLGTELHPFARPESTLNC